MGFHIAAIYLTTIRCSTYRTVKLMAFVTDPIGIAGEQEAAKMLEKKGFKVIEHNWRMGHLEVDLILVRLIQVMVVYLEEILQYSILLYYLIIITTTLGM